jgi:hypothetical protein
MGDKKRSVAGNASPREKAYENARSCEDSFDRKDPSVAAPQPKQIRRVLER